MWGTPLAAWAQGGKLPVGEVEGEVQQLPVPESDAVASSPLQPAGGQVWSAYYTYGVSQSLYNSVPDIDIVTAGLRWSHLWSEKFGGVLRGNPAFAIEVVPITRFLNDGRLTWAGGGNLLYEHHFAARGRLMPVWKIGAGALFADHEIPRGETRLNFSLITALGVDVALTDRSAVFVGYRFHHVSNANTGPVNPGINAHTLTIGLSLYR